MRRSDVTELYFITPIDNVPSILQHGILSNRLASKLPHESVAMAEIQERRVNKKIPGAGHLHSYANLYFDAHNPMLCKRSEQNDIICVLQVNSDILDLPGVIVADRNAASDYARFDPPDRGLAALNKDTVFARYWTHPQNQYQEWTHKSIKCAEVPVPDKVQPNYILGAYVANDKALANFAELGTELTVCIKNDMFF